MSEPQTVQDNHSLWYRAMGNLAFLLSVIRCGEQLSADEESAIQKTIEDLGDVGSRDPLRASLEALIEKWRKQSRAASKFAEWHPNAAQDLKDSAAGQAYAFDECANELLKLLSGSRPPATED